MTKKKGYPKEIKSYKGLKNAYQRIYEQSGGIPRHISILKQDDKAFLEHCNNAMIKLEPKETNSEHTIRVLLNIPEEPLTIAKDTIDLDSISTTEDDISNDTQRNSNSSTINNSTNDSTSI